jgi:hypothetical protein
LSAAGEGASRLAACACGRLTARCAGEPLRVSACHCLQCQRRTGAPFGVVAFWPRAAVEVAGPAMIFERVADSGLAVLFRFCPSCGSTVWWEARRRPDAVGVAVGAFADPAFPAPEQSVFEETRHPWVAPCQEGLARR